MNRCKKHARRDCSSCETGIYARRSTSESNPLLDPMSPLHQATYGGPFYGSTSTDSSSPSSSSSCEQPSSSYDSSSSSSSYDSGSSSYDSGC